MTATMTASANPVYSNHNHYPSYFFVFCSLSATMARHRLMEKEDLDGP
jgi:hypothetical protein